LEETDVPGHFDQTLVFYGEEGKPVDYNVIWLDEDSAIEYDCTDYNSHVHEYCIHIMSRTPTMSEEKLAQLQEFALSLDLNPMNIEWKDTDQSSECWD